MKRKENYADSKTLPASNKDKERHWPEVPWVSPTTWNIWNLVHVKPYACMLVLNFTNYIRTATACLVVLDCKALSQLIVLSYQKDLWYQEHAPTLLCWCRVLGFRGDFFKGDSGCPHALDLQRQQGQQMMSKPELDPFKSNKTKIP
jgi:hypothetical protein